VRQALLATLAALACLPASAQATESARLHVRFTPEHLGHGTTIDLEIAIIAPAGQIPSPLTEATISYPDALGVDVSGLGLATCSRATLELLGPNYCPSDSRMGQGSALAELAIGPEIIHEGAEIQIVRAPRLGQTALFFYVNAATPVSVPIILPGLLTSGPGAEESIHIDVPLVPTLPEAPDVAVIRLHATLGPKGLTYYEHVHGHFIPYHPDGILLPNRCPRGGFAFSAGFAFLDDTHTATHATVPCPAGHSRRGAT
jgi:hypothetical protein